MNASGAVPFCQQNTRIWVVVLFISASLVLGFAIWLAVEKSQTASGNSNHKMPTIAGIPVAYPGGARAQGAAMVLAVAEPAAGARAGVAATGASALRQVASTGAMQQAAAAGMPEAAVAGGSTTAQRLQSSFNQAADVIRPSVVNINAVRRPGGRAAAPGRGPRFIDPFDGVPDKVFGNVAMESVGSGVIVDQAGYIVTNHHLVSGAVSIMVSRFKHSAEHLPARLIATDPENDLALLKFAAPGPYPAASLADSSKIEVGDWVLAVGNPFGLGHTVTSGIISARRNSLIIAGAEYRGLIQTDAPINQGSSGGALVDLRGHVVGINTAIYAPTGVFNGTGFAISSNRASRFVARVLGAQDGAAPGWGGLQAVNMNTAAPYVGLGLVEVDPTLAAKLNLPVSRGLFVSSITAGSPAEEADFARRDVVLSLAGQPTPTTAMFQAVLVGLVPGMTVPVQVWRRGAVKDLKLKLKPRFGQPVTTWP